MIRSLLVLSLLVALGGCNAKEDSQGVYEGLIWYGKDTRTGYCFAHYDRGLTVVDCEKVQHLIR